ncbi:MAG: hypothetical protein KA715_11160 [Xanthomonadaceae bacterium]|nr:hypothetical protein [Xanthomonadaceae bacterium]
MKRTLLALGLILSAFASTPLVSHADESYTFIVKKQEEKAKTRWSLAEWFETKEKMKLQDMWLALHSPSIYEFFLGYDYVIATPSAHRVLLGAYASVVGLEGRYETQPYGDTAALFKLRFFGYHVQATHISLGVGVRNRIDPTLGAYRNGILNADAALYLTRFWGLGGNYEYYLTSTPRVNASTVSGSRLDLSTFIDFKFFRVSAGYFTESSSDQTPVLLSGYSIGAKLFF